MLNKYSNLDNRELQTEESPKNPDRFLQIVDDEELSDSCYQQQDHGILLFPSLMCWFGFNFNLG